MILLTIIEKSVIKLMSSTYLLFILLNKTFFVEKKTWFLKKTIDIFEKEVNFFSKFLRFLVNVKKLYIFC
jgi:hypothetical protein